MFKYALLKQSSYHFFSFFPVKYKVSQSMSFEDQNLSSNPEILSFSTHHFTRSKIKGDINSTYLSGVLERFREKCIQSCWHSAWSTRRSQEDSININCVVAPDRPSFLPEFIHLRRDLLSAYCLLGS